MIQIRPLRVAALVDLPLTPVSGGHARGWEKLAQAAAEKGDSLDLTVYFSGERKNVDLSDHVRLRFLPPVFSTKKLSFLPYIPDHTDLAPFHPALAKELGAYDLIHTTDAYFAFARTAERMARKQGLPLTTSFHTDTPSYAHLFTHKTIETLFGKNGLSRFLTDTLELPARKQKRLLERLKAHLSHCSGALATREKDLELARKCLKKGTIGFLRTPVDRHVFGPHRKDRERVEATYNIPKNRVIVLFIGRLDEGKNIFTLIEALEMLIAQGSPVHLIAAGIGPAAKDLSARLQDRVTLAGFVRPQELGFLCASADILAMPSEVEIRSLVAVEALASALPVLVAEKSGVAAHYGYPAAMGIVAGGATSWAQALKEWAENEPLRAQLRREASAFADKNAPSWGDFLTEDFLPIWQQAVA